MSSMPGELRPRAGACGRSSRSRRAGAGRRRAVVALAAGAAFVACATAGEYRSTLECTARSLSWRTGEPVEIRITLVPAASTRQPLWLGGARVGVDQPITLGAGLGEMIWDDGVLGPRRDRAVQLTQPTDREPAAGELRMPLVVLGFRGAPSGSIPVLLHVDVHAPGLPFRAWLPGRDALVSGGCRAR